MKNQNFKWGAMIRYIITIILIQFCMFFLEQFVLPDKENDKNDIPNGKSYDIEGFAKCNQIIDYQYDDEGKLIHTYGYHERDDNSGNWSMQYENIYTYDSKGRLIEDKYYLSYISREEPRHIITYSYNADGSYVKRKSYNLNNNGDSTKSHYNYSKIEDVVEIYDKNGLLINKNDKVFYTYNNNGQLIHIETYDKDTFSKAATIDWDYDAYQSVEVMCLGKGIYAVWADQYNEDWQQISGVWYKGKLASTNITYQEVEHIGKPYYIANYYNGNIVEELFNARTKNIDGYNALSYEFNDYDDSGKIIWHTYITLSGSKVYGKQYLYGDSDKVCREIHYRIYGELKYHLCDGSIISFYKDENNYLTNIIRVDNEGQIISQYEFDKNHKLIWKKKEDDEIITDIYVVQAGDSLYSIAQDLYGDGNYWEELYYKNKEMVGDDPSIIYQGMELVK